MGILDISVISIIVLFVFLGLTKGFIKQVTSIASWIIAFVVPLLFTNEVVKIVIEEEKQGEIYSSAIVFACLFIITFIIVRIIGKIVSKSMEKVGIGFFDSLLGAIWGLAKALIIISLIFLLFKWLVNAPFIGESLQNFLAKDIKLETDHFSIAKFLYENNLITLTLENFKK